MRKLLLLLVVVCGIAIVPVLAAARSTPPAGSGELGRAGVTEQAAGTRLVGTAVLSFVVVRYDTPAHAHAAFADARAVVRSAIDLGRLPAASAAPMGDETAAWAGTVESCGVALDAALLAIRNGPLLFVSFGAGVVADPMTDLASIAAAQADLRAHAATDPPTDLATLLPTAAILPTGFVPRADAPATPAAKGC